MKKRLLVTIILGIIILVVLILAVNYEIRGKNYVIVNVTCQSDSECVKQQTTCCSCSMGGKEECMTKPEALVKQAELIKCPSRLACIAMYACQNFSCGCIKGLCQNK